MWRFAVLALVACYAPSAPVGAPCGPNDACPGGLVCNGGICGRAGGGVDALIDMQPDAAWDAALADARIELDASDATCPASYTPLGSLPSKYRSVTNPREWVQAQQDCENDGTGTHLAVVNSQAEHDAIDAITGASGIWFGLNDRITEGKPLWVTGSMPTFTVPAGVNNTNAYDCAGMIDGEWGWGECITPIAYVCECDGIPADPSAY